MQYTKIISSLCLTAGLVGASVSFSQNPEADNDDHKMYLVDGGLASSGRLVYEPSSDVRVELRCDSSSGYDRLLETIRWPSVGRPVHKVSSLSDVNNVIYCKGITANFDVDDVPKLAKSDAGNYYLVYSMADQKLNLYQLGCREIVDGVHVSNTKLLDISETSIDNHPGRYIKKSLPCYDEGHLVTGDRAPTWSESFADAKAEVTVLGGRDLHPQYDSDSEQMYRQDFVFKATDPDIVDQNKINYYVEDKSCPWLSSKILGSGIALTGQAPVSTKDQSCFVKLKARAGKLESETLTVRINVEATKIDKLVAGYRNFCVLFNNGESSCVGEGFSQNIVKNVQKLSNSSSIGISNETFGSPQIYAVNDGKLRRFEAESFNELTFWSNQNGGERVSSITLDDVVDFDVGLYMGCANTQDGATQCFSEYDLFGLLPDFSDASWALKSVDVGQEICGVNENDEHLCFTGLSEQGPGSPIDQGTVITQGENALLTSHESHLCYIDLDDNGNQLQPDCYEFFGNTGAFQNIPHYTEEITQLDSGASFSCSRTVSGQLDCFGDNTDNRIQLTNQMYNKRYIDFALGYDHGCSLQEGGQVLRCWGGAGSLLRYYTVSDLYNSLLNYYVEGVN